MASMHAHAGRHRVPWRTVQHFAVPAQRQAPLPASTAVGTNAGCSMRPPCLVHARLPHALHALTPRALVNQHNLQQQQQREAHPHKSKHCVAVFATWARLSPTARHIRTHACTHARRAIAASPSTRTHPLSGRVNNVVHVADVAVQRPQRGCDAHAPRLQCMGRSSRRSLTLSSACTRLQTRGLAWPGQNVRDRHMHAAAATTAGPPHKQAPSTEAHLGASPHDSWHRRLQLLLRHLPRRQRLQPVLL